MRDEDESSRYAGVEVEVQKSGIRCLNSQAHVTDRAYVVEAKPNHPAYHSAFFLKWVIFVVRVACPNRVVIRLPNSAVVSFARSDLSRTTHSPVSREILAPYATL
jgi:hypothetical protein